ncbi:MAG TPA: helix-turn-helix domain-containing protein [Acidimicrobiia bacterium]
MSGSEFGGMIRGAREKLGLSHTRLADLVGRSPSIVRAWERGHTIPDETSVLSSLAAVLGLEERSVFTAAGVTLPGPRTTRTLEQSLSEIAPTALGGPVRTPAPTAQPAAPAGAGVTPVSPLPGDDSPPSASAGRRGNHRSPSPKKGSLSGAVRWLESARSLLRRRSTGSRPTASPSATAPAPVQARSYVEDPGQRLLYRMRSLFLLAGIAVMLIVFVWAADGFFDAVGASLDAIFGPE